MPLVALSLQPDLAFVDTFWVDAAVAADVGRVEVAALVVQ
jgi:hypothetical protein